MNLVIIYKTAQQRYSLGHELNDMLSMLCVIRSSTTDWLKIPFSEVSSGMFIHSSLILRH